MDNAMAQWLIMIAADHSFTGFISMVVLPSL
jgi:hypothetical protein